MQLGMDLVRSAREAARTGSEPGTALERRMLDQHRLAVARHELEMRRHRGRVASLKASAVAGGVGAAAFTVVAAGADTPGGVTAAGLAAAGSGAWGWFRARRARVVEQHPPVPRLPPLPPARLRPGARGADLADRVANALMHLYDLVPNVGRLYPQAGAELWRAVSAVEPLLRGQVERLASLDRIEWQMPGSRAAVAAIEAGNEIAGRLREGADALEDLIGASARMLAAPDIVDGVSEVLAPAIVSLEAYAHGLKAAQATRGWGG